MNTANIDYDTKFKEMQSYLPFLEDIINLIENTSNFNESINGIQLSKIKSLKSLLCETEKRMKIENLLKCEQVLKKLKDKITKDSPTFNITKVEMASQFKSEKPDVVVEKPPDKLNFNFYKEQQDSIKEKNENSSEEVFKDNLQMCREKLKELTKLTDSTHIETAKPYEKAIQIVTKAYLNKQTNLKKQSDAISKSITKATEDELEASKQMLEINNLCNKKNVSNENFEKKRSSDEVVSKKLRTRISISPDRKSYSMSKRKDKPSGPDRKDYHNKSQMKERIHFEQYEKYDRFTSRSKSKDSYKRSQSHDRNFRSTHKNEKKYPELSKSCSDNKTNKSHSPDNKEKNRVPPTIENLKLIEENTLFNLKKLRKKIKKELKQVGPDEEINQLTNTDEKLNEMEKNVKNKVTEDNEFKKNYEEKDDPIKLLYDNISESANSPDTKDLEMNSVYDQQNQFLINKDVEISDVNRCMLSTDAINKLKSDHNVDIEKESCYSQKETTIKLNLKSEKNENNSVPLPIIIPLERIESPILFESESLEVKNTASHLNITNYSTEQYIKDANKLELLTKPKSNFLADSCHTQDNYNFSNENIKNNMFNNILEQKFGNADLNFQPDSIKRQDDTKILNMDNDSNKTIETKKESCTLEQKFNNMDLEFKEVFESLRCNIDAPDFYENTVKNIGNRNTETKSSSTCNKSSDNVRRISFEKYKKKLNTPSFENDVESKEFEIKYKAQEEILNRVLTPKELARFTPVISSTVKDSLADADINIDNRDSTEDIDLVIDEKDSTLNCSQNGESESSDFLGPESPDSTSSFLYTDVQSPGDIIMESSPKNEIYEIFKNNINEDKNFKVYDNNINRNIQNPPEGTFRNLDKTVIPSIPTRHQLDKTISPPITIRSLLEKTISPPMSFKNNTNHINSPTYELLSPFLDSTASFSKHTNVNSCIGNLGPDNRKTHYRLLTDRFNVNFPVSANYRGKNPKPLLGKKNKFITSGSENLSSNFNIESNSFRENRIKNPINIDKTHVIEKSCQLLDKERKEKTLQKVSVKKTLLETPILHNSNDDTQNSILVKKKVLLPDPKIPLLLDPPICSPSFQNVNINSYSNRNVISNAPTIEKYMTNSCQTKCVSTQDPRLKKYKLIDKNEDSSDIKNIYENVKLPNTSTKSNLSHKISVAPNDPRICNLNEKSDTLTSKTNRNQEKHTSQEFAKEDKKHEDCKSKEDKEQSVTISRTGTFKIPKLKKKEEDINEVEKTVSPSKSGKTSNFITENKKSPDSIKPKLNKDVVLLEETDTFVVYDEMITYDLTPESPELKYELATDESSCRKNEKQDSCVKSDEKTKEIEDTIKRDIKSHENSDDQNKSNVTEFDEDNPTDESFEEANENPTTTNKCGITEDSIKHLNKHIKIEDVQIPVDKDKGECTIRNNKANNITIMKDIDKESNLCDSTSGSSHIKLLKGISSENLNELCDKLHEISSNNNMESNKFNVEPKTERLDISNVIHGSCSDEKDSDEKKNEPIDNKSESRNEILEIFEKENTKQLKSDASSQKNKSKPEIVSTQQNNQNDLVSTLVNVFKDKQKMLEMLTLVSQKGGNISQKIIKKLELLTEIYSDDEIEERDDVSLSNTEIESVECDVESNLSTNQSICADSLEKQEQTSKDNSLDTDVISEDKTCPEKKPKSKVKFKNEVELLHEALPKIFINQDNFNPAGIRMCRLNKSSVAQSNNSDLKESNNSKKNNKHGNQKKVTEKQNTKPVTNIDPNETQKSKHSSIDNSNFKKQPVIILEKTDYNSSPSDSTSSLNDKSQDKKDIEEENLIGKSCLEDSNTEPNKKLQKKCNKKIKPCPKSKKKFLKDDTPNIDSPKTNEVSKEDLSVILPNIEPNDEATQVNSNSKSIKVGKKIGIKKVQKKKKRPRWSTGNFTNKKNSKKWKSNKVNNDLKKKSILNNSNDKSTINFCDPSYHFEKFDQEYKCKYCDFSTDLDIVEHYKEKHPQLEILISRISPQEAKNAIEETVCGLKSEYSVPQTLKNCYQCRFCQAFTQTYLNFYSHIVHYHTGEYDDEIDISLIDKSIQKDVKNEENICIPILKGYICGLCNYTQVNKENLDKHVASRHDGKICDVFEVNLSKKSVFNDSDSTSTTSNVQKPEIKPAPKASINKNKNKKVAQKITKRKNVTKTINKNIKRRMNKNIKQMNKNMKQKMNKSKLKSKNVKQTILPDSNDDKTPSNPEIEKSIPEDASNSKLDMLLSEQSHVASIEDGVFSVSVNSIFPEYKPLDMSDINSINELNIKEEIADIEKEPNFDQFPNIKSEPLSDSEQDRSIFDGFQMSNSTILSSTENLPPENGIYISIGELKAKIISEEDITYMCNINNCNFFSESLVIFTNHINSQHAYDIWNGFCAICNKSFDPSEYNAALDHLTIKHMNQSIESPIQQSIEKFVQKSDTTKSRPMISVRPISEMLRSTENSSDVSFPQLKIENIVSLNPNIIQKDNISSELQYLISENQVSNGNMKKTNVDSDNSELPEGFFTMHSGIKIMFSSKKLFCCSVEICNFSTNQKSSFLNHLKLHLNNSILLTANSHSHDWKSCLYCKTKFNSESHLMNHIIQEHALSQFVCSNCEFRSTSYIITFMHSLLVHEYNNIHSDRVHYASIASGNVPKNLNVDILSKTHCISMFICTHKGDDDVECNRKFYTVDKYLLHVMEAKHNVAMSCQYCDNVKLNPLKMIWHLRKVHHYNVYRCLYCNYNENLEKLMINHLLKFHSQKRASYYVCRNFLTSKENWNNPLETVMEVDLNMNLRNNLLKHFGICVQPDGSIKSNSKDENKTLFDVNTDNLENLNDDNMQQIGQTVKDVIPIDNSILRSKPEQVLNPNNSPSLRNDRIDSPFVRICDLEFNFPKDNSSANKHSKGKDETKTNAVSQVEKSNKNESNNLKSSKIPAIDMSTPISYTGKFNSLSDNLSDTFSSIDPQDLLNIHDNSSFNVDDDEEEFEDMGLSGKDLFRCGSGCNTSVETFTEFVMHINACDCSQSDRLVCYHCKRSFKQAFMLQTHISMHGKFRYKCGLCKFRCAMRLQCINHLRTVHGSVNTEAMPIDPSRKNHHTDCFIIMPVETTPDMTHNTKYRKSSVLSKKPSILRQTIKKVKAKKKTRFGIDDIPSLPHFPILTEYIYCAVCSYSTKVTYNLLRHLQLHATSEVAVSTVAPVNPVPHLQTNEMHFDKMTNLALSSNIDRPSVQRNTSISKAVIPKFIVAKDRFVCGSINCRYMSLDENMLVSHWNTLHSEEDTFHCVHCQKNIPIHSDKKSPLSKISEHLRLHSEKLYSCSSCQLIHSSVKSLEAHISQAHENATDIIILRSDSDKTGSYWECRLCHVIKQERKLIINHAMSAHNGPYLCSACPHLEKTRGSITQHQQNKHPNIPVDYDFIFDKKRGVSQKKRRSTSTEEANDSEKSKKIPKLAKNVDKQDELRKSLDIYSPDNFDIIQECDWPTKMTLRDEYLCGFCKTFTSNDEELLRIHLYEELDYRPWSCIRCHYKSFDEVKIKNHCASEHKSTDKPKKLKPDIQKENFVESFLAHQRTILLEKCLRIETSILPVIDVDEITESETVNSKKSDVDNKSLVKSPPPLCSDDEFDDDNKLVIDVASVLPDEQHSPINKSKGKTATGTDRQLLKCKYCDFQSIHPYSKQVHEMRHWKIKPYKCKYCDSQFVVRKDIIKHHKRFHNDFEFQFVRNVIPAVPEIIEMVKTRKSKCPKKVSKSHEKLDSEYNNSSNEPPPKKILKTFGRRGSDYNTSSNEPPSKKIPKSPEKRGSDYNTSSNEPPPKISRRTKLTKYYEEDPFIKINAVIDNDTVIIKCSLCDESFSENSLYKTHFEQVHNAGITVISLSPQKSEDVFMCAYCDEKFSKFISLVYHHGENHRKKLIGIFPLKKAQIQDTGEIKPNHIFSDHYYECIILGCKVKCNSLSDFNKHIREHYHIFRCGLCIKSFQFSAAYIEHCKVHHSCMNIFPKSLLNSQEEVKDRIEQINKLVSPLLKIDNQNDGQNASVTCETTKAEEPKPGMSTKMKQTARKSTAQISPSFYNNRSILKSVLDFGSSAVTINTNNQSDTNEDSTQIKIETDDDIFIVD